MADQIIPDGTEPLIGVRVWTLGRWPRKKNALYGYTGTLWPQRRALHSHCPTKLQRLLRLIYRDWAMRVAATPILQRAATVPALTVFMTSAAFILSPPLAMIALFERSYRRLLHQGRVIVEECNCGIYALHPSRGISLMHYYSKEQTVIFGKVALWGEVVEGHRGYRAQFGYPVELFIPGQDHSKAELAAIKSALEEGYGVPVTIFDGSADALAFSFR